MDLGVLKSGEPAARQALLRKLLGDLRDGPLDDAVLAGVAAVAATGTSNDAGYAIKVLWRAASKGHDLSAVTDALERATSRDEAMVAYQAAAALAATRVRQGTGPALASPSSGAPLAVREGAAHGVSLATARGGTPPVQALADALADPADGVLEHVLAALLTLSVRGEDVSTAVDAMDGALARREYTVAGHAFATPDGASEWRGQSPARDAAAVIAVHAARRSDGEAVRHLLTGGDRQLAEGARKGLSALRRAEPSMANTIDAWLGA